MISKYKEFRRDYYLYKNIVHKCNLINGSNADASGMWKYFFRWRKSVKNGASSMIDRLPWITFEATDLLNNKLKSCEKVFEFGGGGSTLFFLDRNVDLITVEHNQEWFAELTKKIGKNEKWKGVLKLPISIDNFDKLEIGNPDHYISDDSNFKNKSFINYVNFIDEFENNSFDIVCIDGRARPSCVKHAIPKLKKGGWLILDNSERDYYNESKRLLDDKTFKIILDRTSAVIYSVTADKTAIWEKL